MTFAQILFGFRGRIDRTTWWIGAVGLNLAGGALTAALTPLLVPEGATIWGSETAPKQFVALGVTAALLWPTLALAIKRRHDRDNPGLLTALLFLVLIGLNSLPIYYFALAVWAFSHWGVPGVLLLAPLFLGLWLWVVVVLGFLPGTPGPNRYGPPPGDRPT